MLAQVISTIHSAGINWALVAAVSGAVATVVGTMLAFMFWLVGRRDKQRESRDNDIKELIGQAMTDQSEALQHMSDMLMAKLETKETVARISERLARVEGAAGLKVPVNG